jgi:hypothetical protein
VPLITDDLAGYVRLNEDIWLFSIQMVVIFSETMIFLKVIIIGEIRERCHLESFSLTFS